MTTVLRLALCSKYAQVDTHWEILCLVPGSAAEGRHMVSMMSLLSDQASSPICNFNENQTPALQLISAPRISNNKGKKHSPYRKNWSHQYPVTKAQAAISDVTQKKGTLYPSLDSDLLRWRTTAKQVAGGNISSDAGARAGELWLCQISPERGRAGSRRTALATQPCLPFSEAAFTQNITRMWKF